MVGTIDCQHCKSVYARSILVLVSERIEHLELRSWKRFSVLFWICFCVIWLSSLGLRRRREPDHFYEEIRKFSKNLVESRLSFGWLNNRTFKLNKVKSKKKGRSDQIGRKLYILWLNLPELSLQTTTCWLVTSFGGAKLAKL